jgi:hypothetical protein
MFQFKENIAAFYTQIPKTPTVLKDYPCLTTFANTVKQGEALLKSFAKKGIFNAVPIGKSSDDFLVMRLEPAAKPSFGVVFKDYPTAMTLSSSADHLVLSAIVFADIAFHYFTETRDRLKLVNEFAMSFGGSESTAMAFWEAFPQYDTVQGGMEARRGGLWHLLEGITGDPLFTVLAKCWTMEGAELLDWFKQFPVTDDVRHIVSRAKLGAELDQEDPDLSIVELKSLLMGDDIFDSNYSGTSTGYDISDVRFRVTVQSAKVLQKRNLLEPEQIDVAPALLDLIQKREDCNGLAHLAQAKAMAAKNPILAFHLANNGSAFHRFNKGKRSREFFDFLKQLADAQDWRELQAVYGWMDPFV